MMRKLLLLGILAGLILLYPVHASDQHYSKIVLISLDGVQYNHLGSLYLDGKVQNISRLISEGGYTTLRITDHQTVTAPGHATMLTGYDAKVTGVYTNELYSIVPDGYMLWERLPLDWYSGAIFAKRGSTSLFTYAIPEADYWFDITMWEIPSDEYPPNALKWYVIRDRTREFLDQYHDRNFFLFVHFSDPDMNGHIYGENSVRYSNALINNDIAIGDMLNKLNAYGIYSDTAVLVTTDHGFIERGKSHLSRPYPLGDPNCYKVFFITNKVKLNGATGNQMDVAPSIYDLAGMDYHTFIPAMKGVPAWER